MEREGERGIERERKNKTGRRKIKPKRKRIRREEEARAKRALKQAGGLTSKAKKTASSNMLQESPVASGLQILIHQSI